MWSGKWFGEWFGKWLGQADSGTSAPGSLWLGNWLGDWTGSWFGESQEGLHFSLVEGEDEAEFFLEQVAQPEVPKEPILQGFGGAVPLEFLHLGKPNRLLFRIVEEEDRPTFSVGVSRPKNVLVFSLIEGEDVTRFVVETSRPRRAVAFAVYEEPDEFAGTLESFDQVGSDNDLLLVA